MEYKVLKWRGEALAHKFESELNALAEQGWAPVINVGDGHLLLSRPLPLFKQLDQMYETVTKPIPVGLNT